MLRKFLISILLITTVSDAQEMQAPKFWDMVTNLPEDWQVFSEKTFTKENLGNLAALTALTAGLVAYDYEIWKELERSHKTDSTINKINWHFVSAGDGYSQFALSGLFGVYGAWTNDARALRTASQTVEVILSTGAVVQIMKHVTGRESPFKSTTRTGKWEPFPEQVRYHSDVQKYDAVPSGHIATAYATFIVVWDNYPEKKWIPYVGYPITLLISSALVATGLHWISDIPLGIALGHSFAKIIMSRNNNSVSNYKIVPVELENGQWTAGVQWPW